VVRFSSKARTLESVQNALSRVRVLPQVRFTVGEYEADEDGVLQRVSAAGWPVLAVRSSSASEDGEAGSLAGRFDSVLDVDVVDVAKAISVVATSMADDQGRCDPDDEIFVQPMLEDVVLAGVAFGLDPATGAPYYVLNYDDCSHRTDSVTAGRSNDLKTRYIQHLAPSIPEPFEGLVGLIEELRDCFDTYALDVEFALTAAGEWVLLQVRPLVTAVGPFDPRRHREILDVVAARIDQGSRPQPFLYGSKTVYGIMPDWNPAEIIGVRPKPLALSLYRELITDSIWAYQRHNYGYRNLRSFPLMVHFHGLPYVDVRVSFNSFVPRDLDGPLAEKLVNYYIDRLLANPGLHDKVEFEVVFSCYTLDLPQRLQQLADAGFSADERQQIEDSLRRLTNRIVDNETGLWRSDREKLAVLQQRRTEIMAADLDKVARIYWLLEDCKRYGTLPFAGLARAGFIAVQVLGSLVSVGVLDRAGYDAFMNGLTTVSGQMTRDFAQLDRSSFLGKYGHLRPGTYDLLSPRYDEAPDLYFDWDVPASEHQAVTPFSLSLAQMRQISGLLVEHGLAHDVVGLFDFLQAGIELREQAKFIFSRNVSDAMSLFRSFGADLGFSADDMAYADIKTVYELYSAGVDPVTLLSESIEQGRSRYDETCQITLPPLITSGEQVFAFEMPSSEPNFVTQREVRAPVVPHTAVGSLSGAIVAIPNADPGFDWLFSHDIAGLITAYGGVNSHTWPSGPANWPCRLSSGRARSCTASGRRPICSTSTARTEGSRCCDEYAYEGGPGQPARGCRPRAGRTTRQPGPADSGHAGELRDSGRPGAEPTQSGRRTMGCPAAARCCAERRQRPDRLRRQQPGTGLHRKGIARPGRPPRHAGTRYLPGDAADHDLLRRPIGASGRPRRNPARGTRPVGRVHHEQLPPAGARAAAVVAAGHDASCRRLRRGGAASGPASAGDHVASGTGDHVGRA
jgi:hypothetical protein